MKSGIVFFVLLLVKLSTPHSTYPQVISLDSLVHSAIRHHPNTEKLNLEEQSFKIQRQNISSIWNPDLTTNAFASYQSMVPEFPLRVPGLEAPAVPKARYQLSLDISQQLYDGGITKERLALLENEKSIAVEKQMAERFPVQQQVVEAWYHLRTIANQVQVLGISYDDLGSKRDVLIQREKQGLSIKADIMRVELEQLRLLQQIESLAQDRLKLLSYLSDLTGLSLNEDSRFDASPAQAPSRVNPINRAEMRFFVLQQERRTSLLDVQKAQRKPKLSGYAQAAYGKPGLDIFSDDFSPFWQAGIRASWQIWDKGNLKRDQQLYQISYRQIELDKELFDRSLKLALDHYWYEITKDEQASVKDQEIMNIREAIKMVTESQFESGLITSSDLIQEVRLVEQARLQLELRKTHIQQAYTMIRVIRGEL